jgi:O-antigen/teichoic acid export membrane protein
VSLIKKGIKNSSFLFGGRFITIAISFLTSIYIMRELSLDQYGVVITVKNYINFFMIFCFSGLSTAVLLEGAGTTKKFAKLYESTNGIKLLIALIVQAIALIALFFMPYSDRTIFLIILFSFSIPILSIYIHWKEIFTAHENFFTISLFKVIPSIIYFIVSIIFVKSINNVEILISTQLLLNLFTLFICTILVRKKINFRFSFHKIEFKKKLFISGGYFFIISFAGMIFAKIDVLMISILGNADQTAIYSAVNRFVREGAELRTVLYAGFFPVLIKKLKNGSVSKIKLYRSTLLIFTSLFVACVFFSIYGSEIIILLLTEKYSASAYIFKTLIFYLVIEFTIQPYVLLLTASQNHKSLALIFSILAISNIILNIILFKIYGPIGVAYSTLFNYSLFGLLVIFYGIPILKKSKAII